MWCKEKWEVTTLTSGVDGVNGRRKYSRRSHVNSVYIAMYQIIVCNLILEGKSQYPLRNQNKKSDEL